MYQSLSDDVKWLLFSTEVKVRLESRIPGAVDVYRCADGKLLFVVNTIALDEVFVWFTPTARADEIGVDALVELFAERARAYRNKQS